MENITELNPQATNGSIYYFGLRLGNEPFATPIQERVETTKKIALHLFSISTEKDNRTEFMKMMRCAESYEKDQRYSRCRNRMCLICNIIKQHSMSRSYLKAIQQMQTPTFVTLTLQIVSYHEDLGIVVKKMFSSFSKIKDSLRKSNNKIFGMRKLEVVINSIDKTFHFHFHLIVDNRNDCAIELIKKWQSKNQGLRIRAQNAKLIQKGDEKQVLNYLTKPFYKFKEDEPQNFYMLHKLYISLSGIRKFQNYGGFKKIQL